MDFKFNFKIDGDHGGCSNVSTEQFVSNNERKEKLQASSGEPKHFKVKDIADHWLAKDSCDLFDLDEIIVTDEMPSLITLTPNDPDREFDGEATDIVASVYEGGFKVWECTLDLVRYFEEADHRELMKDRRVLDVGCGVGILGVYALVRGRAAHVTFQDYNDEVILDASGPTALANLQMAHSLQKHSPKNKSEDHHAKNTTEETPDLCSRSNFDLEKMFQEETLLKSASDKMNFTSGDWSALSSVTTNQSSQLYDVVLSSETIYNVSYFDSLHEYLMNVLAPGGVIFMSAKLHYFGVGGGVTSWRNYVTARGVFDLEVIHEIDACLKRQILRLVKKRSED